MSSRYSQGVAGIFFSTGSRLLSCRFTGSRWVILLNGFQTIVQQVLRESLGHSFQRVLDYCPLDSQGVAGLFFSMGPRLLSSRFPGSRWVILLNGFQTIVQYILRESLGYSSQRLPDYCQVDSEGVAGLFSSTGSRLMSSRYSQGVAGIFFSTGSRLLSSRFTGSRWVILLNGFQTIVQQILRDSLGHSSQRVLDYCPVDSQGVVGLFFSAGSRLLSSRFTGSRCIILLNGFQTNVQQIFTGSRWDFLLLDVVLQIHRESLGYSSQRVPDYCPVGSQGVAGSFFSTGSRLMSTRYSQGVAGIFFSTGSRLLSCRFTGSRWVILLNGFQTIVQQIHRESLGYSSQRPIVKQIHRESLGYSSQRVLDECPLDIHRESLGFSSQRVLDCCPVDSQGVAGLFFSTGSRLLSSRFTGSRWLFFSTVSRLLSSRDSQGVVGFFFSTGSRLLSSRYSQGVAGLYFSTASRLLSSRFSGSRWVILLNGFQTNVHQIFTGSRWDFLLNGFQTVVLQIHRESLGYSSQRVLDYCPVDSGSRSVILLNGFQTIVVDSQGVAVILLNGFQNIVQQIHRESLGYSSQRVPDYCPVDSEGVAGLFFSTGSRLMSSRYSQGVAGIFFSTGSRLLSSRFTGSRWVILLNGFQNIVQQIHRESLGYSSQRVPDYCPVDSEGFAGSFFSTGSRLLSSRFTGSRWSFFSTGSQRVLLRDCCPVDSQGVAGLFFSTGSRLLSSRFLGSRWVILLNGFQTIVHQIHRESLGYSSQRVHGYCPVDSQGVAGLFFSTGSRLLSSIFSGSRWLFFSTASRLLSSRFSGSRWVILLNGFQTIVQQFTGSRWVILLNGFQTIVKQIHRESLGYSSQRVLSRFGSRWVILLNGFQTIVQQIHRESLGYSSQRVLDYCPVDSQGVAVSFFSTGSRLMSSRYSQGVAGIFFSTGSRLLSCRFTGSRWVILLNGFQTIVQQVLRESLGHSSQRVLDYCPLDSQGVAGLFFSMGPGYCPVDSQGVAGLFFSTGSRLLSSIFSGSRWVILLNGFQTIAKQILRESLGYSPQRVLD